MLTREICKKCGQENPIGFSLPDKIWKQVVSICCQKDVICIYCFIKMADILLVEWDKDIKFYPISSFNIKKENKNETI